MRTGLLVFILLPLSCPVWAETKMNGFVLDGALVPVREIRSGGPPKDGIPALDLPDILAADKASYLDDSDRVLGISLNGRARAYPIRILNYHEIVNDVVGSEKVVITYCPLCGSGVAFDAEVNGRPLEFGVSGLLYNSDVLMYDRQTDSLWSQIMKTAVAGAMKGATLTAMPLKYTTWGDWRKRHPHTDVLSTKTGYRRNYNTNPYAGYDRTSDLYFAVDRRNRAYHNKMSVMGVELDGFFKAYPFEELRKGPSQFSDSIGGQAVEVEFDDDNGTASVASIDGTLLPSMIVYWFAWYTFHPDTDIYTTD